MFKSLKRMIRDLLIVGIPITAIIVIQIFILDENFDVKNKEISKNIIINVNEDGYVEVEENIDVDLFQSRFTDFKYTSFNI